MLDCLLETMLASVPADKAMAARAMVLATEPRDAMEVAKAAGAVMAFFAAADSYARASRQGMSDTTAMRLRSRANGCMPTFTALQRPVPAVDIFQPRDRFGQPIKRYRWQDMTMAQRRATYASPRDPEFDAIAIAEQEAMIAEQKALEAAQQ